MDYRLGVDLGTNSLGWCVLSLDESGDPNGVVAAGSRIFSDGRDPKSGASLAVDRRSARSMRRRRDRFRQRQRALMKHLTADGLFPADADERRRLAALDPYALRARALDEELTPHEIGRAFFHLNQRRGFKSNRKADRGKNDDAGKIAVGIDRLREKMREAGARTYGEFLHMRRASAPDENSIPSVRTRLRPETGEGAKGDGYDFYPGRALIEEEFERIWEAQAEHHPNTLTPEVHDRLFEIVFHQRPLKTPKIGTCTFIAGEERLPKAHPLFQRRRLLEEVNALEIVLPGQGARKLERAERDVLLSKLSDKKKVTFATLRKGLKLDPDARFNKETDNRSDLLGDEVVAEMTKRFGKGWAHLPWEAQWKIVSDVREQQSDDDTAKLIEWLCGTQGLLVEEAQAVAGAHLPEGFGRFGLTATKKLIAALESDVITYDKAVGLAGLGHHSDFRLGEAHDDLPYYGAALERHIMPGTADPNDPEEARIGRLTNPTVHIGLNQLRRLVNGIIKTYGRPKEIAVELARELKLTDDDKARMNKENRRNQLAAEERSNKLREIGQPDTGANRARLRLWEELNPHNALDRRCVYTGQMISIEMLFSDSVDIDHILPFTATLDDSNANKIVCLREANRQKRKRTPFEAFGHTAEWEDIAARAARLPSNKSWRFQPDAMQRFDRDGGFLARQLIDTQYLSRLAREYLSALYPHKGEGSSHVWVSPGRLTEMVRRKLGLNDLLPDHNFAGGADQPKNRLDHRHHAIDAAVVGVVDRRMLAEIARISGLEGADGRERIKIPEPWEGFRDDLKRTVNAITVSHRPDHGTAAKAGLPKGRDQTAGRLHNDTAYGFTGKTDARGNSIVVHRVPLDSLKPEDLTDGGKRWVVDDALRNALAEFTDGKPFEEAVRKFATLDHAFKGIRRVRVAEPLSVIPIRDREGHAYKGYKGDSNYRYDVWELKDGKWTAEVVSMFEAHQPGWVSGVRRDHPSARKVLSLHQNDLIAIEREGERRQLMRVVKFNQAGVLTLAEPHESGALKSRDAASDDPFKYMATGATSLKKNRARQVRMDELGRVRDPGFPARTARRRTRPGRAAE